MIRDHESKQIENENLLGFFEWLDKETTSDGVGKGVEDAERWYKAIAEEDREYWLKQYEEYKSNMEIGE
jgi:hypothetical protein